VSRGFDRKDQHERNYQNLPMETSSESTCVYTIILLRGGCEADRNLTESDIYYEFGH